MKKIVALVAIVIVLTPWFVKERAFYTTEQETRMHPKFDVRFHCTVLGDQDVVVAYPAAIIANLKTLEDTNFRLPTGYVTINGVVVKTSPDGTTETFTEGGKARTVETWWENNVVTKVTVDGKELEQGVVWLVNATRYGAIAAGVAFVDGESHKLEVRWDLNALSSVSLDGEGLKEAYYGTVFGIPLFVRQ